MIRSRIIAALSKIGAALPSETRRSEESQSLQQISTPLELAYVASLAARIVPRDVVLEPSAGTCPPATRVDFLQWKAAMKHTAREVSRGLAERVEAVCKHYLSNGRRSGNYWIVGDVNNHAGRSLFVRLKGPLSGRGARGKWIDYVALLVMLRRSR